MLILIISFSLTPQIYFLSIQPLWFSDETKHQLILHFSKLTILPFPIFPITLPSKVFNNFLPLKVRCLSKVPTYVKQIGIDNNDIVSLNNYIHKETNITNNTIAISVNDYIRKQKSY